MVVVSERDCATQTPASWPIRQSHQRRGMSPTSPHRVSPTPPPNKDKEKGSGSFLKYAIPAVVVGGASVLAAPLVLGAVGFTSGGIAAGSLAAKMMSMAAIANGGGVAAGGVVATLQSVGAAGLGSVGTAVTAGAGAAVGAGGSHLAQKLLEEGNDERGCSDDKPDEDDDEGGNRPSDPICDKSTQTDW